jgi:AraC-like DNA-binding protein
VSEAAFESGFESPAHFSRSFKARFGKNPAEARQQRNNIIQHEKL